MIGPCPYSCTNKTEFGYCKTTACLYAPTIKVAQKTKTQADRIRAMNDEELALVLVSGGCPQGVFGGEDTDCKTPDIDCRSCWLEWLKKEADNG